MSFILDALRKSEHERQRATLPGLAQVPLATPPAQLPRWALVVMGVLIAAVLVLGGAWWQSTRVPAELATAPATVERPVPLPQPEPPAPADRATSARTLPADPAPAARDSSLSTAAASSSPEATDLEPSFSAPSFTPSADEPAPPSAAALAAEGISLPELRLELLAFREQPRERFVFINGRKYAEGERLIEGPQLLSIRPTGAVLVHAGRRFLLASE